MKKLTPIIMLLAIAGLAWFFIAGAKTSDKTTNTTANDTAKPNQY